MPSRSWKRYVAFVAASVLFVGFLTPAAPASAATARWSLPVRVSEGGGFRDVTAYSPTNRWAVGSTLVNTSHGLVNKPLIERWNGDKWFRFRTPAVPKGSRTGATLKRVVVRGPKDVWVVGASDFGAGAEEGDFVAHWNGARWSEHVLGRYWVVAHLAVVGAHSVWALAQQDHNYPARAVYARWDGDRWSTGTLPAIPAFENGVSAPARWAVAEQPKTYRQQLLHFDGSRWRVVRGPKVPLPRHTTGFWYADIVDLGRDGLWVTVGYSFHDGQGPGLTLFRKTSTGWRRVLHLSDQSPRGGAVSDGRKGLWIMSSLAQPTMLHVVGGRLTRRVQAPVYRNTRMQIEHITAAPGHRTVFAIGEFYLQHGNQQTEVDAIARYTTP